MRIAALYVGKVSLGKFLLNGQHRLGNAVGLLGRVTCQSSNGLNKLDILGPDTLALLVEVVVAVAQAQARLTNVEYVCICILLVGAHASAEKYIGTGAVNLAQQRAQIFAIGNSLDCSQVGLNGLGTLGIESGAIQAQAIEVAQLLLDRACGGLALLQFGKQLLNPQLVALAQHIKGTKARVLGRHRVIPLPASGKVLIKIIVQRIAIIEVCRVECRSFLLLATATRGEQRCRKNHNHCAFHKSYKG